MGIGVIGASSGAIEATPAGAGAKVATLFCGNTTKYNGMLSAGNYVVDSDFTGGIFDGDKQIAQLSKGALTKFTLPSNSSNITVENFFPEFESRGEYQGNNTVGFGVIPNDMADSYTSTNGLDGIYANGATVYYTKDGGQTFMPMMSAAHHGITNLDAFSAAITPDSSYWYLGNYNNSGNRFAYSTDRGVTWTAWDIAGQTDSSYRNVGWITTDKDGNFVALLARDTSTNQHLVVEGTGTTIARWWYYNSNTSFNYVSSFSYHSVKNIPNSNSFMLIAYTGTSYTFDYVGFKFGQYPQGQSVAPESTDYLGWNGQDCANVYYRNDHFLLAQYYRPNNDIPYGVLKVVYPYPPNTRGYGNGYLYTYSDWSNDTYTNSNGIYTAYTTPHSIAAMGRMSVYTRDSSGVNLLAWGAGRLVVQDKANPTERGFMDYGGFAPGVKRFFDGTIGSTNKAGHMLPDGSLALRIGSVFGVTAKQAATIYQEA